MHTREFLLAHTVRIGGASVRAASRPCRCSGRYASAILLAGLMSQMTRQRYRLGVKFLGHAEAVAAEEMLPGQVFRVPQFRSAPLNADRIVAVGLTDSTHKADARARSAVLSKVEVRIKMRYQEAS